MEILFRKAFSFSDTGFQHFESTVQYVEGRYDMEKIVVLTGSTFRYFALKKWQRRISIDRSLAVAR